MSKNFELMQEAVTSREVPPILGAKLHSRVFYQNEEEQTKRGDLSVDRVTREEYLKLVRGVFLSGAEGSPRVVVFAGVDAGSGSKGICMLTAVSLADHKLGSVCLVDGNLRSPSSPGFFDVSNHYGLTDALREQGAIRGFAKQIQESLWLLSSGSMVAEPSTLLYSEIMKGRIAELRKEFDYVLIDAPAFNTYADGVVFGRLADGVVLILEANRTRRQALGKVAENLSSLQIRLLGAVLNRRTYPIPEWLYRRL